jgi:hypothetical protein
MLNRKWTLWHDKKWTDLREVGTFGTIVEFWQFFNNIKSVSSLPHKTNLRVFEHNVHPSREDPKNSHETAGVWIVQFYKGSNIDDVWIDCVMDLIGENELMPFGILGVELNVRTRGCRIGFWCADEDAKLGEYLSTHCGSSVFEICFKRHIDVARSSSSFAVKPTIKYKPGRASKNITN